MLLIKGDCFTYMYVTVYNFAGGVAIKIMDASSNSSLIIFYYS